MLPRIPLNGTGKGIDDCRESLRDGFPEFWRQLIDRSVAFDVKGGCGPAIRLLEREKEALTASADSDRDKQMRRVVRMIA